MLRFCAFLFVTLILQATAACAASVADVGFEEIHIDNGAEPALVVGIWYPTHERPAEHEIGTFKQTVALGAPVFGTRLALVVLSHGGGGSYESHFDTALALAQAGFVAAAVSHAGDTYDDQSQVLRLWRRPAQLHRLISYMLSEWPQHERLDETKVGAFGFSNGGFTVLVAAGGVPDLGKIAPYCASHPTTDLCSALKHANVDLAAAAASVPPNAWISDARIKAAVVAAPAFGFAFDRAGSKNIRIPIELWRAADDHHQPNPGYEEAVRRALPRRPEYHVIAGAGHYDFLPPCSPRLAAAAPSICMDAPRFDRAAFHRRFNAQIVRFFMDKLGR